MVCWDIQLEELINVLYCNSILLEITWGEVMLITEAIQISPIVPSSHRKQAGVVLGTSILEAFFEYFFCPLYYSFAAFFNFRVFFRLNVYSNSTIFCIVAPMPKHDMPSFVITCPNSRTWWCMSLLLFLSKLCLWLCQNNSHETCCYLEFYHIDN